MGSQAMQKADDNKDIDSRGRPCKYESHVQPRLNDIYKWVKDGMTDYSIAESLGIAAYTFIKYKKIYSDLIDTYTRAHMERNCVVVNSVFKKAQGHKATLRKQKVLADGSVIDFQEEQYIPPDTDAAKFWLTNRDPEAWRDKVDQDVNVNVNVLVDDSFKKYFQPPIEADYKVIEEKSDDTQK